MTANLAKGWIDELKFINGDIVLGVDAEELLDSGLSKISQHLDVPLRIYASMPPDEWIHIGPSRVERGDGAGKSAPPVEDIVDDRGVTSINLQTGSIIGEAVTLQGETFVLPTSTASHYRRMAVVHQPHLDNIDIIFSDEEENFGSLTNVGGLLAQLDGNPIGWVDLEATSSQSFKTIDSLTDIIENKPSATKRIWQFGSGAGVGGGGDTSFKAQSLSGSTLKIKKGYGGFASGLRFGTGNLTESSDLADLDINLSDILAAPDNSAYYGLYVDREKLPAVVTLSDNKRKVHPVYSYEHFTLVKDLHPEDANPYRFAHIADLATPASGNTWVGAEFSSSVKWVTPDVTSTVKFVQRKVDTSITTAASHSISHTFVEAEPNVVSLWFWDNTASQKIPLSEMSHILYKDNEIVQIDTSGLSFESGDYVEVEMIYIPSKENTFIDQTRVFKSAEWMTGSLVGSELHGLQDKFDLVSVYVLEWDTITDKVRSRSASSLVTEWDDEYIYYDWAGLEPSSSHRYRVFSSAAPLPYSRPADGNTWEFDDAADLTASSTEYSCDLIYGDHPRSIVAVQKFEKGWKPVDNLSGLVWVTDDNDHYLQGDISSLVPSGSNTVRITVE